MSKTYYIIRHGLTQAVKDNRNYTDDIVTAEILPEFFPVVERVGLYLKEIQDSFNVCSRFLRCVETADIISKVTGKKFNRDKRLNEFYQITFDQLVARLVDFLEDMEKRKESDIIVCTHGGSIAGLAHLLSNGQFKEEDLSDYPMPGILTIIKDKKVERIDFNKLPFKSVEVQTVRQ